jgi:hypothetical protein
MSYFSSKLYPAQKFKTKVHKINIYKVRFHENPAFSQGGMVEDPIPVGHAALLSEQFPTFRKTQYVHLQCPRGHDLVAVIMNTSNFYGERMKRLGLKIGAQGYTETSVPTYRTT